MLSITFRSMQNVKETKTGLLEVFKECPYFLLQAKKIFTIKAKRSVGFSLSRNISF
jgi:hypothetical protein